MVDIGSYPFARDGRFGTSLVVRGTDTRARRDAIADISEMLRACQAEFSVDSET
jgi:hypothetical protein